MRWRRDRDDNADLADEEYAWWTGRDRRKEAGQPPAGMPERRGVEAAMVPPPPAPSPPPLHTPPPPAPSVPVPSLPPLVAVTPEPTPVPPEPTPPSEAKDVPTIPVAFPFEAEADAVRRSAAGSDPGPDPGPERDPATDPWHRSTSPQALAAYRALGIDWEASWDEVVEVFRDHAALWHPDRLAGTDPLVQAEGQRRMSEMNRAYAELRRMLRPSRRELFTS